MVVQTDPPPKPRKQCNIKQKRSRRLELAAGLTSSCWFYDPFGTWPSFAHRMFDVYVETHRHGTREASCGPSLCINQRCRQGSLWIDRSIVGEERVACSSAVPPVVISPVVRPVVVSWVGPIVLHVASGSRGQVSCRSPPVKVNHPHVDFALDSVPEGRVWWDKSMRGQFSVDQFDDTLVRFYGYPDSDRQVLPPHTPRYNKWIGRKPEIGSPDVINRPICLRNIRVGKPAVHGGLHIGGVSRFMPHTFVQNLGGRKTNIRNAFVRVEGGHHEGRNYFAPGCKLNSPLPGHCRVVCIDTKKPHWCSIDSVSFHSFAWPQNIGKA